jgi:uncharacterized membrane protein YesL
MSIRKDHIKMSLFGNYKTTGAGISKDAPPKKPFFRFWELVFRKFWKLLEVNILMMSSLLPLLAAALVIYYFIEKYTNVALLLSAGLVLLFAIFFGPVIAGCTQILRNFSREKPMFLMDTFFKTVRSCFKSACLMGIINLAVGASAVCSFRVYPSLIETDGSTLYYVLFILTLSVTLAVLMMSFYAYLMIVSTDLSMKNILKNSLALSFIALKKNLLTLLISVAILGAFVMLTMLFPYVMALLWIFMPISFVGFIIVFNCYPVIQKYVINPYYAQRGEVSPELAYTQTAGENVFEDQGGKEKNEEPKKQKKKGKVIS